MCGIVGWLGEGLDLGLARSMRDQLAYRGPDHAGEWQSDECPVWLGHRRLSIQDLSTAGHQPMVSNSGRYVLSYNGEVYNFQVLAEALKQQLVPLSGQGDTAVLLAAIDHWGLQETLPKLVGMFAFSLYDCQARCLWLVRDRLGEKPLYYSHTGSQLAFASELRPLTRLPWVHKSLDQQALSAYFHTRAIPAPQTIFQQVRQLEAGCLLRWSFDQPIQIESYWSLAGEIEQGRCHPLIADRHTLVDELEIRLQESVRLTHLSDAPLGAFLSGGIDSSLVVALMQAQSTQPIETFSIAFDDRSHDESVYAREVARHLGTRHHQQTFSAGDLIENLDRLIGSQDEPFADSGWLPSRLLSEFVAGTVKVAVSGDGGDELFGGYPRYFWARRIQQLRKTLTPVGTHSLAWCLMNFPDRMWNGIVNTLTRSRFSGTDGLACRVQRFAAYLVTPPDQISQRLLSVWPDTRPLLGFDHYAPPVFNNLGFCHQMMAVDQHDFLVNDVLRKVDRCAMQSSLEVRAPLLDHRLLSWSWRLPESVRPGAQGDQGKWLLRQLLGRYLPKSLIDRPKQGFNVPLARWLRGELQEWAGDLLGTASIERSGVLTAAPVRDYWRRHLRGEDHSQRLWTVLMYLEWENRQP
jgi:asparagine synthase (glutamine-hydrolysing)